MNKKFLIVIAGPTAVGKTAFAVEAAQHFSTEIISADSRQFYKELKIGVARPSEAELALVKHHFIASHSIHDYFTAGMYELSVIELLNTLFKNYDVVVLTGGSGLYIDAVCNGIDDLPDIDMDIRNKVLARYSNEGIEPLLEELKNIDPAYYQTADLANPKRIFKALEIYYMTGKPYSEFLTNPKKERNFNIIKIVLNKAREELYEQINRRVDMMMAAGLLDEAHNLYTLRNLNALNTVGYKELFEYFDNKISLEQAVDQIKQNTRHYAKRQITWFKRNNDYTWFDATNKELILQYLQKEIHA